MFVIPTNSVGISQRVVATLVAGAVVFASAGYFHSAQAANLTSVSNTLSSSNPSVTSSHTIEFTVPTGSTITTADDITITWDARDQGAVSEPFDDIETVVGADLTVTGDGAFTLGTFTATADSITFDGLAAGAGDTIQVVVADGKIVNPAKVAAAGIGDSYEVLVEVADATNGTPDSGRTRVAIIDTVEVTAEVASIFDFVISPLAAGTDVNGETTTDDSSTTTIPFGEVAPGSANAKIIGQQLNVTTNAINGFVVTVEQDSNLISSTGADIDGFVDGTYTDTPTVWASPTNTVNSENTYGHWGLTSEDDLNTDEFGTSLFVSASTTPREIFSHDGVTNGTVANEGVTQVAYKLEITPLQEAGDDYNTTLTYIATPTF
jgi:hypothetical protein